MKLKKIIFILFIIILLVQLGFNNKCIAEETNEKIKIYSESAILIESRTGKILYEKNIHERKYPASTTKILTAIIALENCKLDEKQTASYEAVNSIKSGYTNANIQVGETFTIGELLDVMMLRSANEAANIIAEHISGNVTEFSKLMNKKAKEIGCFESNFVNPNGVHNDNHYSTAYDMAMIARYCMQNEKFREIVAKKECKLPVTELWQEDDRIYKNTNNLLIPDNRYYYKYCNGIKTGFTTPAKNCMVSSSNKDGFETISVILHAEATEDGASARYTDTINLFEYGYNNYNLNDILEEYDLIDYPENDYTSNSQDSIFDLIEQEKSNSFLEKEWIEIFLGIAILLVVGCYYLIRWLKREDLRNKLYNFKLNQ